MFGLRQTDAPLVEYDNDNNCPYLSRACHTSEGIDGSHSQLSASSLHTVVEDGHQLLRLSHVANTFQGHHDLVVVTAAVRTKHLLKGCNNLFDLSGPATFWVLLAVAVYQGSN